MSENAVLWAFGILIGLNGVLAGAIVRSFSKRLDSHAADIRSIRDRLTRLERNGEPKSNRP